MFVPHYIGFRGFCQVFQRRRISLRAKEAFLCQTLKKQALTLTIANGFTRGLGFLFRLMTARLMGAEAIGVMELSASAAMLALTPATAGLP